MKKIIALFLPLFTLCGCVKITEEDVSCQGGTVEAPIISINDSQKNLGETVTVTIDNPDFNNLYFWNHPDGSGDTTVGSTFSLFLTSTQFTGKHSVRSKNPDLLCVSSPKDFNITVDNYVPTCTVGSSTVTLGTNYYTFYNGQDDAYADFYRVYWSQSSNTLQLNMGNYYKSESTARAFKVRAGSSPSLLDDDECNMSLTIIGQGYTAQSGTVYVYYENFDYKVTFCNVVFKRNTNGLTYNSKADLTFY